MDNYLSVLKAVWFARRKANLMVFLLALGGSVLDTAAAFSASPLATTTRITLGFPLSAAPSNEATTIAKPPAIQIENLSCSHDGQVWQLNEVSYVLARGSKTALVGRNGCGKSTLLRILADVCCKDQSQASLLDDGVVYTGSITAPRDVRVAFVEQEPPLPSDVTVADALLGITSSSVEENTYRGSVSVFEAVRRYRRAAAQAEANPQQFAEASATMDACDGWAVLQKADEVATRLRVRHLSDMKLSELSGGERKRVALAAALVQEPDVLLLDEPTNHLDLAAIEWLSELFLDQTKLTILVVTHDRAFLDRVCNNVLELDRGSLYSYDGNYATFLEGKQARLELEDAAISSARTKYRRELDWMRRQPQARQSKSKSRIDAFYKLEKATKPRTLDPSLTLDKDGQRRLGGNILKMKHVSLAFGDRVMLDDFSYDFSRGDKIGICGGNGVGKSTFIRILSGLQHIDSGEIELGETIVMGVYDQMGMEVERDVTVLEFVQESVQARHDGASIPQAQSDARNLLKQFEFPRQRWNERVSILSGGERRRLQLLDVLSKKPNFLILDEPSNDVDLDTLSALESYLEEFSGVLIVVSHDRFFTDKVTDHLFIFEGNGQVKDFSGSLSEYAECLTEQERLGPDTSSAQSASSISAEERKTKNREDRDKRNEQRNAVRQMKKDLRNLENAIERLKPKAIELQNEIDSSSDQGWTVIAELTAKLESINEEIEEKELRWMEIAEQLEVAEQEIVV